MLTRRELLKSTGKTAVVVGLSGTSFPDSVFGLGRKSLKDTLSPENYNRMTKKWDPIYGPLLSGISEYGGLNNYDGHKKQKGMLTPGTDYDVGSGTPLVPATPGFVSVIMRGRMGALILGIYLLSNFRYVVEYVHLDDILLDYSFEDKEKIMAGEPFRVLQNNEPVAISGNTGKGVDGGILPPHLHVNLLYFANKDSKDFLDFEKYRLDGGKPIFWDGETWLGTSQSKRLGRLESTLQSLELTLESWKGDKSLEELAGKLKDYYNNFKDLSGTQILDSKHFQDLRALLKRVTLEGKDYIPETKPYSLAQKVLAYSMVQPYYNQPIIVCLPFISPQLVSMYKVKKPVYEEGPFYILKDGFFRKVKP